MSKFVKIAKQIFCDGSKIKYKRSIACCFIIISVSLVTVVGMKKTITINIDGNEKSVTAYMGTIKDVLEKNNIEVFEEDKLNVSLDSKIKDKEQIEIKRAVPVTINAADKEIVIKSADDTVEEMLENQKEKLSEAGIEYNKEVDELIPSVDSELQAELNLKIIKVEKKEVVEKQTIDFDTVIEKSNEHDTNYEKVKSEGIKGEKEVVYEVVYKDGVEDTRSMKSTKIVTEPQNKVIVKGTNDLMVSRGSGSQNKKVLKCSATAYSGGWGTSSGRKPCRVEGGLSTIAVDPSVIPMGTKVYVEGYGYAVAADTGTSIKGNKIDVYFNSYKESCDWGLKQVDVTIIANPGEW